MEYLGIKLSLDRDSNFSEEGLILLERYYAEEGRAGVQKAIARVANCFSFGDRELAQRVYDQISSHRWFPSSPIFSNAINGEWLPGYWEVNDTARIREFWQGEDPKAMPIACFLAYLEDSIKGQVETASELSYLSVMGGGTAVHSRIRATSDKAPGPIPYIKTLDGVMGYYRQGKTRRGSTAIYMDVSHPDIPEFIRMRHPSGGGDAARKIDNRKGVHLAINLTDEFEEAVSADADWTFRCPHTGDAKQTVKARQLWEDMLEAREFTGEPFLWFVDTANRAVPPFQRALGLKNNGSNLCTEITLPTTADRTAVCCLSSYNLERHDASDSAQVIKDMTRFLDNVIEWFIAFAPATLKRAVNSAKAERAIGIGFMGWAYYLMKNNIPYEGGGYGSSIHHLHMLHRDFKQAAYEETKKLAEERGEPEDCIDTRQRNSHLFAIAPNVNSSVLCNTSPSCEPLNSNAYTQKSRAGIHLFKNKYLEDWLIRQLERFEEHDEEFDRYDFINDFWDDIVDHNGSVQHLDWMDDHTKKVFLTAWEIDQHWVVQQAEERQPYLCQAASTNLFFSPGTDRAYINSVHLKAMKGRVVKGLYYFRTGSEASADTIKTIVRKPLADWKQDSEECVACQG